ncbi:hypothetical protein MPNT_50183 [Candidatus Methylacidithermus pantelleriae]|uniref:Uncharacterized protein n=1 Tax=Candidatus Methylacidithermus pantelleriae TaxID=2744239 RepID=A0A8J2BNZ7_9BACT|nr:hypothetical protein MPNT_50183 [Candidatus Methylacidithermus pantelleriae]
MAVGELVKSIASSPRPRKRIDEQRILYRRIGKGSSQSLKTRVGRNPGFEGPVAVFP